MSTLVITGGEVLDRRGRRLADVVVDGGRVTAVGHEMPRAGRHEGHRVDADGLLVAPGFVDLQCNGAGGIDLAASPERMWEVAALLPRWGVTSWLPTIVSSAADARRRALETLRHRPADARDVAEPIGLHLEGPFLASRRRGAHAAARLVAPDAGSAECWSAEGGVAMVTLAPELPGALDLVRALVGRGVVVSAGHSDASASDALAGFEAGVSSVTHLFNAMAPLHHREPGLVGVALADRRVRVGLIADGLHVDPLVVGLVQRLVSDRLVLVTDAVAALGAPPGATTLDGDDLVVTDDGVRRPDGTLAGSNLSMDRAVRNLVSFSGCSIEEAVRAATVAPASLLGLARKGGVAADADADLVLLTPDLEVVATIVAGSVAFDRREGGPWRS